MSPKFLNVKETYELDNKRVVNVEVDLDYNRSTGLEVEAVTWLDHKNDLIAFTSLPFHEQVWLMDDLNKKIKRHCASNFEQAFAHFELERK